MTSRQYNEHMELIRPWSSSSNITSNTPLFSVLSYIIQQQTITSMLMILNFSYLDCSHNIAHQEYTIANVSNWMSSNFLSLNPSKTEFLIFGLSQLSKLNNPNIHLPNNVILSTVDSAGNLSVIFNENPQICKCTTYLCCF